MDAGDAAVNIGGVILGALLGYGFARFDERRRRRQDTTAIRAALRHEIAANLGTLADAWTEMHAPPATHEQRVASPAIRPAVRLAQRDPPRWRRSVWEDRAREVVEALNADELERVGVLYRDLARFDALRVALGKPAWSAADSLNFFPFAHGVWDELVALVETALAAGNPLPPTDESKAVRRRNRQRRE